MIKKKIAVIGLKGIPAFGGAATVGEHLINELKDQYDFTVLGVASHSSKENTLINGIPQKVFSNMGKGGLNTFYYYIRCLIHVISKNYDMIHLHHAESGFITPLLRLKYRVVVTFHGVFEKDDPKFSNLQNRFFRFSEWLNVRFANVIVSVSNPNKEYIDKKYKTKILYIPNGIHIENNRSMIGKNENYTITFAAGRIYHIKGLHILLESLKQINQNISLVIIGDLKQVPDYETKIIKQSEGLNVTYKGLIKKKEELFEIIQKSNLFIFPSLTEAMSMMLLEVASLKTPIIASDIPANKSVFSDSEVLFFESENPEDLAEKINYAINNPEMMTQNAINAYEKLIQEYNWKFISEKYKEIINDNLR